MRELVLCLDLHRALFFRLGIIGSLGFQCHPGSFLTQGLYRLLSHQLFCYRAAKPVALSKEALPPRPVVLRHLTVK